MIKTDIEFRLMDRNKIMSYHVTFIIKGILAKKNLVFIRNLFVQTKFNKKSLKHVLKKIAKHFRFHVITFCAYQGLCIIEYSFICRR